MRRREIERTRPTIYDLGILVDASTLNVGLFVFPVLVPELCIIGDTVGGTSVSHGWGKTREEMEIQHRG